MFFILSLFICVAMFTIFSNLTMIVKEKNKSIAILRSHGLSSRQVGEIFFLVGFIVSGLGITFGIVIGSAFAYNIQYIKYFLEKTLDLDLFNPAVYFLTNLPAEIKISDIIMITVFSIILAIFASVIPAMNAAKKKPADLLKYF